MTQRKERTGLWAALSRWAASEADIDAEHLRHRAQVAGCTPITDIPDRSRAKIRGTLRTATLQPRAGTPALEADLYDGTGSLTLVWIGRRRITGITCGRRMVATGRLATVDGRRVMYNPRYELLPTGSE